MRKILGFTLAEVLITLGIIGIVAAMSLPALHAKIEKTIIETNLKKTYSDLQNWLIRAEADYGPFYSWEFGQLDGATVATKYASPYMKLTPCGKHSTNRNFSCMVDVYPGRVGFYMPTSSSKPGTLADFLGQPYLLPDGRVIAFYTEYYPTWNPPGKYLELIVDVNGSRGKSIMGQDVFSFSINNFRNLRVKKGRLQVGILNNSEKSIDWQTKNCISSVNGRNCGILIQNNDWNIPDDYPIKF